MRYDTDNFKEIVGQEDFNLRVCRNVTDQDHEYVKSNEFQSENLRGLFCNNSMSYVKCSYKL
jgi:hypothetical protein